MHGVAALLVGVALLRDANALFGLGVLLFGATSVVFVEPIHPSAMFPRGRDVGT